MHHRSDLRFMADKAFFHQFELKIDCKQAQAFRAPENKTFVGGPVHVLHMFKGVTALGHRLAVLVENFYEVSLDHRDQLSRGRNLDHGGLLLERNDVSRVQFVAIP